MAELRNMRAYDPLGERVVRAMLSGAIVNENASNQLADFIPH